MGNRESVTLDLWNYGHLLDFYGSYNSADGLDTMKFINVLMGITTAVALSYWLSSTIPGLDMVVALLLLATPMVNLGFILLCVAQLLYRGRSAPPTQRTKRIPKYL